MSLHGTFETCRAGLTMLLAKLAVHDDDGSIKVRIRRPWA